MLTVSHLKKTFGEITAVNDVDFTVDSGTIMGIIGQNGSGKTTLFRMILGFLASEGDGFVTWNGQSLTVNCANLIGYLPEERGLYDNLTIEEQIFLFAELRGCSRQSIDPKIDDWLTRFNVKGKRTDRINTLSKGNQQKVQVIATLIHEPRLIILDEPFSGLDPVNADFLKAGILHLRDEGACILFSSHNMANVEELCDTMLMIHNGSQVLYGTVHDVKNTFGRTRIMVETPDWQSDQLAALPGVTQVEQIDDQTYRLKLQDESYGEEIFDTITKGHYIPQFQQTPPSLEEIFKQKVGESLE